MDKQEYLDIKLKQVNVYSEKYEYSIIDNGMTLIAKERSTGLIPYSRCIGSKESAIQFLSGILHVLVDQQSFKIDSSGKALE